MAKKEIVCMMSKQIKCPSCGANLDIPDGKSETFCTNCGTKIDLKNSNK